MTLSDALQEAVRCHRRAAALRRMRAALRMVETRPADIWVLEPQDRGTVAQILASCNPALFCRLPDAAAAPIELDDEHDDLAEEICCSGWREA
jgi:hypothetical protein